MKFEIRAVGEFVRDVKKLAKKYKKLANDLENLKKELLSNPKNGISLGNDCYKIRLANRSVPIGKSGGFRVVYYFVDSSGIIFLLAIYSKSEIENISDERIIEILQKNFIL